MPTLIGKVSAMNRVYNTDTLSWDAMAQPSTAAGAASSTQVSVSGYVAPSTTVAVSNFPASQPVSGPLTDAQLRAAAVPMSAASLPLPSDAATQTTLALIKAKTDNLDVSLATLATAANQGLAGKTLKSAKFSLSATGTVIASVASKRIKVYAYKLVVSAALSVKWRDGASTDLEDLQSLAINGGEAESITPPAFLFGTSAGNSLDLVISGIGTAAGRVSYYDDDGT